MRSCAVCKKKINKENGPFFGVPKCEISRQKWSAICQMAFTPNSRLCINHFLRSQVITAGRKSLLMPNAVPVMQNQQNEVLARLPDTYGPFMNSPTRTPLVKPFQEYLETTELPMEIETNNVGQLLCQEQQTQIDSSISYDDVTCYRNKIKKLDSENKELKCQDPMLTFFTDGQIRKLMGPGMLDDLCRICAKTIKGENAVGLFENENKILHLKIKDLTGVQLTNETGLPKLICLDCNSDILESYKKFREDFLKIQALFNLHIRGNKQQKCNRLIKEREFVQIFVVEEETNTSVSDYEPIFEEEKEINTRSNEILSFGDTNDFGLNSCHENALEDTKNYVEDNNGTKLEYSIDEIEAFGDLEVKEIRESDEEFGEPINKLKDAEENPNVFICDQCGYQFKNSYTFKIHLKRHSGDKRCACKLCPDKFFTNGELRLHMRKHTGERPYPCKFCGRRFTSSSSKITHERTHTNERLFACHLCGKSFIRSHVLKNHMLTHTGEKEFKCDICNTEYSRKTNLDAHFTSKMHKAAVRGESNRIKRNNERQYVCSVCDRPFKVANTLKRHMLTHTGVKEFKCDACNKAFARKCQLDAHFTTKIHKQSVENNEHLEFLE